jgi:4-amino-4-deoxy-L-arabinose transferase-like glycosyltransferase
MMQFEAKLFPHLIRLGALAIILVGLALRLYTLSSESLWYDELLQLDIAQGNPPGEGGLDSIFPRLPGHAAVPLDYIISYFWVKLGQSEGWVRLPAVIVGTLTLPLIYQLGRSLLGPTDGLLLMALLAVSPFHLRYSQEVRPYALVVMGVTLAVYGFWRLRQTGRWRYFIPLQVGVLIFSLAHFFAWVIFIPLFMLLAIDFMGSQNRSHPAKLAGLLLATCILPLAIMLATGWGGLFYTLKGFGEALVEPEKFTTAADQKLDRGEGPQVNESFVKFELLTPLAGRDADTALWLFNLLAGLGLFYLIARRKYALSILLSLWLILSVVAIIIFLVSRGAFFASRYVIAILPAYLILLAVGILALPRWLKCAEPRWLSPVAFLLLSGMVVINSAVGLNQLYQNETKENWRLVGEFIVKNAQPGDTVIAMRAEPAINWYYPQAWAAPNYFWTLAEIQETAAQARRSWVVLSIFSSTVDGPVKAWLSEQGAIRFDLDPVITVYYLGANVLPNQLLAEAQNFALPVDHALYASLGAQNRSRPDVARQYYQLAIEHAPNDEIRAEYQAAVNALAQK